MTVQYIYIVVERDQLLPMTHDRGPQITTPTFPDLSLSVCIHRALPAVQPMENVFIDQVQKKL